MPDGRLSTTSSRFKEEQIKKLPPYLQSMHRAVGTYLTGWDLRWTAHPSAQWVLELTFADGTRQVYGNSPELICAAGVLAVLEHAVTKEAGAEPSWLPIMV